MCPFDQPIDLCASCFSIELLMSQPPRNTNVLFLCYVVFPVCVWVFLLFSSLLSVSASAAGHASKSWKVSTVLPVCFCFSYNSIWKDFRVLLHGHFLRTAKWGQFCCLRRGSCLLVSIFGFWHVDGMMRYIHQVYTNTWTHRCTVGSKSLSPVPETVICWKPTNVSSNNLFVVMLSGKYFF